MARVGSRARIALTAVAAALAAGCTAAAPTPARPFSSSDFTPTSIRRFSEFPLYWVGTRFGGWPLVAIDGPMPPDDFITFIYGTCEPRPQDEEASCEPPLEIQVQPLCVHLEVVAADPVWERRSVRSAPVGRIDHAPVLLSRTVQVKVYTDSLAVAWRVLAALRSANGVAPVLGERDPIPASPAAVLRGTHACQ
jgi:hypothetical protein